MFLQTKRLLLREFISDDWTAVHTYHSDPLYQRYYHWTERSEADAREFVQMFLDWQQARPRTKFQLAIIHQEKATSSATAAFALMIRNSVKLTSAMNWTAATGAMDTRRKQPAPSFNLVLSG